MTRTPTADDPFLAASDTLPMAPLPPPDSMIESRAAPRAQRRFVVRMRLGPSALRRCLSSDVSTEGIFVLMPGAPPVGAAVECVLVHPGDGRELVVPARVVRAGETLAGPGVGLAFDALSAAQRAALARYVSGD